ncbi:MAG TPA: sugar phosphate isomerase/epimerase [Clostridiales bacterium]|nr:sugar phosphate isomerase/epimerase [Clostridiales bacterium]
MSDIKFGITLYSFSTEYIHEKLDLEGVLRKARDMGYKGVEIIPAQMAPEYPYLSDEWINELKGLLDKYELEPICWSAYIDMGIRSDRDLTEEEIIQYTVNDMIYAKKAGFQMVRTQHAISPAIFRKMIPYCKQLDMKLTIEMHHPHHPEVEVWKEYFEIMKGEGKGYLGYVIDFSIYQTMPHQLYLNQALEFGCRPDKLEEIIALHQKKEDTSLKIAAAEQGDFNEIEKHTALEMFGKFSAPAKISQIKDTIDCCFYIHGKFYYLDNDDHDPCIPFEELMKELRDLGYKGYIASEYEGHHFDYTVDSEEQLRHFIALNTKLLEA